MPATLATLLASRRASSLVGGALVFLPKVEVCAFFSAMAISNEVPSIVASVAECGSFSSLFALSTVLRVCEVTGADGALLKAGLPTLGRLEGAFDFGCSERIPSRLGI